MELNRPRKYCSCACANRSTAPRRFEKQRNRFYGQFTIDPKTGLEIPAIRVMRGETVEALTLVDLEDYERFARTRWGRNRGGYAIHRTTTNGRQVWHLLHREILGLSFGDGLEGDHINGDRLDNRRSNLRIATRAQNQQNKRQKPGPSGHRGVHYDPQTNRYRPHASVNNRNVYAGTFVRLEDAVAAAVALRRRYMPFAVEDDQPFGQR